MTDDELIEKMREVDCEQALAADSYYRQFIDLVRKQDVKSGRIKKLFRLNTEAAKQNERAKVKAEFITIVRRWWQLADYPESLVLADLIKALEDV